MVALLLVRSSRLPIWTYLPVLMSVSAGSSAGRGVVLLFDHKKARYGMRLANRQELLLKPECLARLN